MIIDVFNKTKEKMEKTLEHFKLELKGVRTGRASVSLFDNVKVDYYGTPTQLSQIASLNAEARMVTIQPWEVNMIKAIEKAIMESSLGLNPSNDGRVIRVPIPALTEERRRELVKVVKKMSEEAKVAIRNERRDAIEKLKKMEKEKQISEDDNKKGSEQIQKLTDEYIKKVDEVTEKKEKEIMEI
ncbi:MAG: ribosome recycling factor [Calditerrivibrio sp.]|nr:ribosome recycling factor [Calditerrivibrio sp.]MCA1932793.1 ribosome recycling factor [Calditerrivibrio sp.]